MRQLLLAIFWSAVAVTVWKYDLQLDQVQHRTAPGEAKLLAILALRLVTPFIAAITLLGVERGARVGAMTLAAILIACWVAMFLKA